MRRDLKLAKYKDIYDSVTILYSKYQCLSKAIYKANISETHYYNICKELGLKSAAYDGNRKNNKKITKKSKKKKKTEIESEDELSDLDVDSVTHQKGGNKYVDNYIENDEDNESDEGTKIFNQLQSDIQKRYGRKRKQ